MFSFDNGLFDIICAQHESIPKWYQINESDIVTWSLVKIIGCWVLTSPRLETDNNQRSSFRFCSRFIIINISFGFWIVDIQNPKDIIHILNVFSAYTLHIAHTAHTATYLNAWMKIYFQKFPIRYFFCMLVFAIVSLELGWYFGRTYANNRRCHQFIESCPDCS